MAFGDGFATLAGTTVGGPRLPWNPEKTWSGLVGVRRRRQRSARRRSSALGGAVDRAAIRLACSRSGRRSSAAAVAGLVETIPIRARRQPLGACRGGRRALVSRSVQLGRAIDTLVLDLRWSGVVVSMPSGARRPGRSGASSAGGALAGVALRAPSSTPALGLGGLVVLALALVADAPAARRARAWHGKQRAGSRRSDGGRRGAGNIIANCLVGALGAALVLFVVDWRLELGALRACRRALPPAPATPSPARSARRGVARRGRSRPSGACRRARRAAISVVGTLAGIVAAAVMALAGSR